MWKMGIGGESFCTAKKHRSGSRIMYDLPKRCIRYCDNKRKSYYYLVTWLPYSLRHV